MIRMISIMLALSLSACTQNERPPLPPLATAPATIGLTVADRLNARYSRSDAVCDGNTPAYECSGVLFRRATYNPAYDFWGHSADAVRLGSVTFSYIRAGVSSNSADVTSGYILMDPESARLAGKMELNLRCIFPFMADTQLNDRASHGCGFAGQASPVPLPDDLSNCATLAVPAVTPEAWNRNFTDHGSDRLRQCSLSTRMPEQFFTSLAVRASFPNLTRTYGNEVLIEPWATDTPERLPIEAIFYNAAKEGSLVNAQALKHAYQVKTRITLPIVKLDFATGAQRFTLKAVDQEDGWAVAQRLNARHAITPTECPGARAPVYCSGILARMLSYSPKYHAWNPNLDSPPEGGISFSYMRADIKTIALARLKWQGIILRELDYSAAAGLYPVQALCLYVADADTWQRGDKGCGATHYDANSGRCDAQGITTLGQFMAHFLTVPADPFYTRLGHQCSMAIAPIPFMVSINARAQIQANAQAPLHEAYDYNEIVLANWPMDIPTQLPIDTFFYQVGVGEAGGLAQAREIQKDLWRSASGIIKPVMRMDLSAAPDAVFSYRRDDQAY